MRNAVHPRIIRPVIVALIVIGLAACGSIAGLGGGGGGGGESPPDVQLPTGLVQRVTVTPETPQSGSDIVVRSVLRNEGTTPLQLTSRICGLNWGGTLRVTFSPNTGGCAGWSMTGPLAPGDSLVSVAQWRVMSLPGPWVLNVGHLLSPSYAQPVPVLVP